MTRLPDVAQGGSRIAAVGSDFAIGVLAQMPPMLMSRVAWQCMAPLGYTTHFRQGSGIAAPGSATC